MSKKHIQELQDLGEKLCQGTEYSYVQDFDKNVCFQGSVSNLFEADKVMKINVAGLSGIKSWLLNKNGLDEQFTKCLVATFHEARHIEQFNEIANGIADEQIASSYLLVLNNQELYKGKYFNLLYEIDAEARGVLSAYKYFQEVHHESEAEAFKHIQRYIALQIKDGDCRYKNNGFATCTSIDEIHKKFEKIYNNAAKDIISYDIKPFLHKYRQYDYSADKSTSYFDRNIIYKCLNACGTNEYGGSNAEEIISLLGERTEQNKFIGSYALKEHPEYKDYFKQFQTLDFDEYIEAYQQVKENPEFSRIGFAKQKELYQEALNIKKHKSNQKENGGRDDR